MTLLFSIIPTFKMICNLIRVFINHSAPISNIPLCNFKWKETILEQYIISSHSLSGDKIPQIRSAKRSPNLKTILTPYGK